MRKIKGLILLTVMSILSALWLTSCKNKLQIDVDKCAEMALEYMNEKYQTEFELYSGVVKRDGGGPRYAEITLSNKNDENLYDVIVYPDGSNDEDKDDYYDTYKVISDEYMCYLLQDYAKNEMNELLLDAGLERFISAVSIEEMEGIIGFSGFSSDFSMQTEETFSLGDILNNCIISMHCWIDIPDSEYNNELKEKIGNVISQLLTSDDSVLFSIDIYGEETYNEIEELNKNNISYNEKPDKNIRFVIEEEKDEFK